MNFAKKTAAFAMSAVMLISSLAVGTTAFAATQKTVTPMVSNTQSYAAKITPTIGSDGRWDYDVESKTYYSFTPAATGWYNLTVSSTPIYRNETGQFDSWGYPITTYSYTAGLNASRVDEASVSVYEKFNANTYELKDCVGSTSTQEYVTSYVQKTAYAYPTASTYAYYDGVTSMRLVAGQTYYIEAYSDYWSNPVEGSTTDERVYFTGATFSFTPTDWSYEATTSKTASADYVVNSTEYDEDTDSYVTVQETVTRSIYTPYASLYYVGTATDVVVPDVMNNMAVKYVEGSANKNITSLTLSNNVKSISGFDDIKSLAAVNLASVETISSYCFSNTGLTSVTIPATVKTIGSSAFSTCASLTSVNMTAATALKSIGSYAFYNTGLKAAVIPSSVNNIGAYAFGYEDNLNTNVASPYAADRIETPVSGFVMGGYNNSEASDYAAKYGITYYEMSAGCPHPYNVVTTPATLFTKGSKVSTCPLCGATTKKSIAKKTFKIKSLKSSKKGTIVVKASKQDGITGYQVQYSTSKKFTKKTTKTVTVKSTKALNKTIKGLKNGKKYYVRVRAYSKANGKTAYSKYTATKSVKVK